MRATLPLFAMLLLANCASAQADAFQQRLTLIKVEYQRNARFGMAGVGRVNRGPGDTLVPQGNLAMATGQPSASGI